MTDQPDEHGPPSHQAGVATATGLDAIEARRPLLLATKLRIPPAYHAVVTRGRLLDRLEQSLRGAVTVIAAPAGFGKTTLLGDWSRRTGRPTAWVSLDEGENDPTRFWSYAIAALEQVHPVAGLSALSLLQSPQPPPLDAVLTVLINELAEMDDDVVLVLDDYHLVEARAVHQSVAFLIDHLPSRLHVILTTRSEPPLPLARWRARGLLQELSTADLRFETAEAAAFLGEAMGLHLGDQETAQLVARTEGWIAGLQLIALSLPRHDDVGRFIRELSGTQRFVLDYLADEVLARQDERTQAFLLQTSILERLSGPLCDAVTGYTDSQALLRELERANLFVVPLDDERRWYRYHHLFAEFLRGRLQRQNAASVAALHRRAAQWYEANGLRADAIDHFLAAADYAAAATLIEQSGQARLMAGELATVQGWLAQLPEEVVAARPRLCLLHAWLLTLGFHAAQATRYLHHAEEVALALAEGPERRALLQEIAAVKTTGAAIGVDVAGFEELSRHVEGLQEAPGQDGGNVFLSDVRHLGRALALEWTGDIGAAHRAYQEISASSQATGNVVVAILALSQLGDQYVTQGRLRKAAATYRQGLQLAAGEPGEGARPATPIAALAHFGLALVLVEWDELETAQSHLEAALAQGEQLANRLIVSGVQIGLGRLYQAQGQHAAALDALDRAGQLATGTFLGQMMTDYVDALRVRSWIALGARALLESWVTRQSERQGQQAVPRQFIQLEALAEPATLRALIALGRPREALALGEVLQRKFEAAGMSGVVLEVLLLAALAHRALGEQDLALAALARSLALAAPEGYTRLYVDEGPPAARLLDLLRRSPAAPGPDRAAIPLAYLDRLLAAHGHPSPQRAAGGAPPAGTAPGPALVEPLSEREREVLRLVADGLSNQDIAAALVVEVSTVKTHLLRLYGKLDVHSRTQAVSRARELRLVP